MTAATPGLDLILMQHIADIAMGWAAMEPVARAFLAVGLGGALTLLWLGLARQLDRSALVRRPSRGFALGLAAALIVPRLLPPALAAFLADRIGPALLQKGGVTRDSRRESSVIAVLHEQADTPDV
ncbi:hypothetical protein, partial [Rubrimonas cliftonensis]